MTELPLLDADEVEPGAPSTAIPGVLTNRWNLLEILSRRCVLPLASYRKHYADLLDLTPGRVPLVRAPVGPRLVGIVTADDPVSAYPVFIEVSVAPETALLPALGPSDLVAVHFRSEAELREHEARAYVNIADWLPRRVTPGLFVDGADTPPPVGDGADAAGADFFRRLDALCGAAFALVSAPADPEARLGAVADLIGGRPRSKAKDTWMGAVSSLLPGTPVKPRSGEPAVLAAALDVVSRLDDVGDAIGVLDDILLRLRECEGEPPEELLALFASQRRVLAADADPGIPAGHPVVEGLVRFLLDPGAALEGRADQTDDAAAVAAVLAGALHGRSTLDVAHRQGSLDAAFATLEVRECFRAAVMKHPPVRCRVGREPDGSGGERVVLSVGDEVVHTERLPPPALASLLPLTSSASPEITRAATAVCRAEGWEEVVSTLIEASDFRYASGRIEIDGIPPVLRRVDMKALGVLLKGRSGPETPEMIELRRLLWATSTAKRGTR